MRTACSWLGAPVRRRRPLHAHCTSLVSSIVRISAAERSARGSAAFISLRRGRPLTEGSHLSRPPSPPPSRTRVPARPLQAGAASPGPDGRTARSTIGHPTHQVCSCGRRWAAMGLPRLPSRLLSATQQRMWQSMLLPPPSPLPHTPRARSHGTPERQVAAGRAASPLALSHPPSLALAAQPPRVHSACTHTHR